VAGYPPSRPHPAHNPGFTFAALTALTIGIGATASIFSVVNKVFLQPLPYRSPENIVQLGRKFPVGVAYSASIPKYMVWRDNDVFSSMALYDLEGPGFNIDYLLSYPRTQPPREKSTQFPRRGPFSARRAAPAALKPVDDCAARMLGASATSCKGRPARGVTLRMSCVAEERPSRERSVLFIWGQTPPDTKLKTTESDLRGSKSASKDHVDGCINLFSSIEPIQKLGTASRSLQQGSILFRSKVLRREHLRSSAG
jgi:hypothetical protein